MPSTGSTSPGSRSNVQLRQSCSGPQMPMDSTGSSPSSRRTIIVRFAHGQARATTRRYRPASTGKPPSRPSAVIRPFRYSVLRTNSPLVLTLPTLPHCLPVQISPRPLRHPRQGGSRPPGEHAMIMASFRQIAPVSGHDHAALDAESRFTPKVRSQPCGGRRIRASGVLAQPPRQRMASQRARSSPAGSSAAWVASLSRAVVRLAVS